MECEIIFWRQEGQFLVSVEQALVSSPHSDDVVMAVMIVVGKIKNITIVRTVISFYVKFKI